MTKICRNNLKKLIPVVATLTILFVTNLGITNTILKVNAFDLPKLQVAENVGQSLHCVIVVVGCNGTGSVGSSGDTIIGSNNGNNNTNDSDEPSTLLGIDSQAPE